MPERIVTDRERVLSCRSLLESRFPDRHPTVEAIMSITGLSHERVLAAEQAPAPPRRPATPRPAGLVTYERTERLRCEQCGGTFTRTMTRGRKPSKCPECRA